MKTIMMLTASMASAILAFPFDARNQQCNVPPSAAANAKLQPISQPSAGSAEACSKACSSNSSCKSYLFGLPADADVPACRLYSVAAAQVPSQRNELYVFDKACSGSKVPKTKPTHGEPRGKLAARDLPSDKLPPPPPQHEARGKIPPPPPPPHHERRDEIPGDKPPVGKLPPRHEPRGDIPSDKPPSDKLPGDRPPPHHEPRGNIPSDKSGPKNDAQKNKDKIDHKAPKKPHNNVNDKQEHN